MNVELLFSIAGIILGFCGSVIGITVALTAVRKSRVDTLAEIVDALAEENRRLKDTTANLQAENLELKNTIAQLQAENRELRCILREAGIQIPRMGHYL